ncbi:MAG: patatin-like phospholipase family protein [Holosporales bacterium]|jgi:NTE family protein|nr:patatin-like phospholipase family protein [Holosporales bacterium]
MLTHPPKPNRPAERKDGKKAISIAMQGGGAHGAFTWGVLDRLLEDGRFIIEGITGASAGAMNAAGTIQGLLEGGNEGARRVLRSYWTALIESGKTSALKPGPVDQMLNKFTMQNTPAFIMFDLMLKFLSPYQYNPMGLDPLKDLIMKVFDFEKIRKNKEYKLFMSATHVYTGKIKVFKTEEFCPEALLATACLPTIHAAVMVNGEYYWDGGFIGNPVIYPLVYECETPDILVIKLNPTHRNRLPTTSGEISDRLNEITNNTSILREMRSIHFITKLIDEGLIDPTRIKKLHMHLIQDEAAFQDLGWSSKLNTDKKFVDYLFAAGYKAADKWISENFKKIGVESTMPMDDLFMS